MQAPLTSEEGATGGQQAASKATPYRDRAEAAGIDVDRVEHVSSASDINLDDHTCYVVSGEITGNIEGRDVTDVAIIGTDDARLAVSKGDRGFDVNIRGGSGFLWSDIDLDQRAHAAYGRIRASLADGLTVEHTQTIGSGGIPGRPGAPGGPALYIPATDADGTHRLENVSVDYQGNFPEDHKGNLGAMGIWFGPNDHKGTLDIVGSQITGFPNNGIYCSASGGEVNVYNSRIVDNGVSQCGRINRGVIEDSVIGFDAERAAMDNAWRPDHGVKGVGSEQKKAGSGEGVLRIKNCEIRMANVARCGGGAATYTATTNNHIGAIVGCDFVMENCGDAPAIVAMGGPVGEVRDCTFNQSREKAIRGDVRKLVNNEFGQ